jgi:hypothetical protein
MRGLGRRCEWKFLRVNATSSQPPSPYSSIARALVMTGKRIEALSRRE